MQLTKVSKEADDAKLVETVQQCTEPVIAKFLSHCSWIIWLTDPLALDTTGQPILASKH